MITKDMTIAEILKQKPESAQILMGLGMGCLGCPSASMETLVNACEIHGLELNEVLEKLNQN